MQKINQEKFYKSLFYQLENSWNERERVEFFVSLK